MLLEQLVGNTVTAGFRFVVNVDHIPIGAFTECQLPTIEWEVETLKEGGLNTYVHQLPGPRKAATITFKNGVALASHLMAWYLMAMNEQISRRQVRVALLSPLLAPVMVWDISDAYPIKWTGPQMRSDDNTIAVHTLALACNEITVI